jgi:hypothetical protein
MKSTTISLAVLGAAALAAGCAETHSSAMGAGAGNGTGATQTVCGDGTVLPPNSRCAIHGGVVRGNAGGSSGGNGGAGGGQ